MSSSHEGLEDRILAALELALAEGRTEAAEHLLRALEALCSDVSPGSLLADAYLTATGKRTLRRPRH